MQKSLKKILITAGPTREMLDPVRFLSNLSTGEMGYTLAALAKKQKYQVTLISGPTALKVPRGVRHLSIVSARDLREACAQEFLKHDALIMTAAVADFTAASQHPHKIHRVRSPKLLLKRTPDIVAGLAKKKGDRLVIGFCLETKDWIEQAKRKLKAKHLDGIVANYYHPKKHVPFGARKITVGFLEPKRSPNILKHRSKAAVANRLLKWLEELHRARF